MSDLAQDLPVTASPAGWGRRRWLAVGTALAVLLAGGTAYLVVRRGGVAPGTQVEVRDLASPADRLAGGSVQLPLGRLDVTAAAPVRALPADTAPADGGARPGGVRGGGRWVGVEWTVTPVPATSLGDLARLRPRQVEVALVADGTRHDLAAATATTAAATTAAATTAAGTGQRAGYVAHKAVYLALPGEPASLRLAVGYDGVTQTLDLRTGRVDAGAVAPLYASARWTASSPPCETGTVRIAAPGFAADRADLAVLCTLDRAPTAVPYLPGKGWARPGRTWLTVLLRTQASLALASWPSVADPDPATYRLRLVSSAVTAAGAAPAVTTSYYQQGPERQRALGLTGAYYSFDVPAAGPVRLALHQVYADTDGPTGGPAGAPRQARGTVDLTIELRPQG